MNKQFFFPHQMVQRNQDEAKSAFRAPENSNNQDDLKAGAAANAGSGAEDPGSDRQGQPTRTDLSFGQKAVGINFNPGGHPEVNYNKVQYASIIDQMNNLRNESTSPEQKRLCSVAITEAQAAQMWAVKAITWQD